MIDTTSRPGRREGNNNNRTAPYRGKGVALGPTTHTGRRLQEPQHPFGPAAEPGVDTQQKPDDAALETGARLVAEGAVALAVAARHPRVPSVPALGARSPAIKAALSDGVRGARREDRQDPRGTAAHWRGPRRAAGRRQCAERGEGGPARGPGGAKGGSAPVTPSHMSPNDAKPQAQIINSEARRSREVVSFRRGPAPPRPGPHQTALPRPGAPDPPRRDALGPPPSS